MNFFKRLWLRAQGKKIIVSRNGTVWIAIDSQDYDVGALLIYVIDEIYSTPDLNYYEEKVGRMPKASWLEDWREEQAKWWGGIAWPEHQKAQARQRERITINKLAERTQRRP